MPSIRPLWLSRDTMPDGTLSHMITVWSARPTRFTDYHKHGGWWLQPDRSTSYVEEVISVSDCIEDFGTAPDHDNQLIRVGS